MYTWSSGRGDVVAQFLTRQEINAQNPGLLKQISVGPNEAAVVIRNGKPEEPITQERVRKFGGGLFNALKSTVGGGEDVRVLFVQTSPVDLQIPFGGESLYGLDAWAGARAAAASRAGGGQEMLLTKDDRPAMGVITLRFSFDLANAVKVFNLIRTNVAGHSGSAARSPWPSVVTKGDLAARFHDELVSNVLLSLVRSTPYAELAGSEAFRTAVDASMVSYLRKTFETFGLTLGQVFVRFDATEFDRVQEVASRQELEERKRDIAFNTQIGDERRTSELVKARDQFQADLLIQHQHNLRTLAELQEETVDVHYKAAKARARGQREDLLDAERARADEAARQEAIKNKLASERASAETDTDLRTIKELAAAKNSMTETSGKIAIQAESIRANADVEKAKAVATAAAYNLDAYKAGVDMAERHTEKMAGIHADMVRTVRAEPAGKGHGNGNGNGNGSSTCPSCGEVVKSLWKVCPDCGTKLTPRPIACSNCGEELKSSWKTCPECGTSLLKGGA